MAGAVAAGMVLNIVGQIREGKNAIAQARTQRALMNWNAVQSEKAGNAALEAAKFEEQRLSRQENMAIGSMVASGGKSGIASTSPSRVETLADQVEQYSMDRSLTLRQGLTEKLNQYQQAIVYRWQGKQILKQGEFAAKQAYLKAWAMGLTGVGALQGFVPAAQPQNFAQPTANQNAAFNAGFGPVSSGRANQIQTQIMSNYNGGYYNDPYGLKTSVRGY